MLTIGQLAAHAGVSIRAVRHYHKKGLLPEPERDGSGYRRYDSRAVVKLIRIRTLAEAGVPLSRVKELLAATPEEFATAVEDIDRRLRNDIRERQQHRQRIAQLATGDSLALPAEAVTYFDRMRELGFSERFVEIERDSWIMIAAQMPDAIPALMEAKLRHAEDESLMALFHDLDLACDYPPDDPRLTEVADRVAAMMEKTFAQAEAQGADPDDDSFTPQLVALLDDTFLASFPSAPRLLELLERRGWTGWTMIKRNDR